MLTGKCKEDFEKWYPTRQNNSFEHTGMAIVDYFYGECERTTDFSMQYGVYVDFFDSVGINVSLKLCGYLKYDYSIKDSESQILLFTEYDWSQTRPEARQKAILKANEIYNTL